MVPPAVVVVVVLVMEVDGVEGVVVVVVGGLGFISHIPHNSAQVYVHLQILVKFFLKPHTDDTYNLDFTMHFSFRQRWVHSPLSISPLQHCIRATVDPGVQDFMQFSLHSALV